LLLKTHIPAEIVLNRKYRFISNRKHSNHDEWRFVLGFLKKLFGQGDGYRSKFTRSEWQSLQKAPFWVFLLVAGSDGGIAESEMREIGNQINVWRRQASGFSKDVLDSIGDQIESIMKRFVSDTGRDALEGLVNVNKILQKIDSKQSQTFKKLLVVIGIRIGESSGSMTEDQKKILALIYGALDVEME
jgi:hypothetical protein